MNFGQVLDAGMSPRAVADRLGHSTPVVTLSVYSGSIPAHDAIAAQTIAAVLPSSSQESESVDTTNREVN
jgi:hypothetical protein